MAERAHPEDPAFKGTIYEERLRERYNFCQPYVNEKRVLDAPCGTGWGSSFLLGCNLLLGIDLSYDAVLYGTEHYPLTKFVTGRLETLPFRKNSFDVILCLEGIEHIYFQNARQFLREAWRILDFEGILILTAPLLKNGKHSGNPFHFYEFRQDEINGLLNHYFDPIQEEIFDGPDGPEMRYVGRRKEKVEMVFSSLNLVDPEFIKKTNHWVQSLENESGFQFSPGNNTTILSSCFAILIFEGLKNWFEVESDKRQRWISLVQNDQDEITGQFYDDHINKYPIKNSEHDRDYLTFQMTYFAINALDSLNAKPLYPLSFLKDFDHKDKILLWLENLNWSNPWLESNRVMFLLFFLLYQAEVENNITAPERFHFILDWLNEKQDPDTGLWGTKKGASTLNAVAAAYHFVPFFKYVHRPILKVEKIIDAALSLQKEDGLFGHLDGGGACEDADAIDLLASFTHETSYRSKDIKKALIRSFWALNNLQNEDGSFPYSRRKDNATYQFSNWEFMEVELNQGDSWATWFRLVSLATISNTYPNDVPSLGMWLFRRWPALGYHIDHFTSLEQEKKHITFWQRPFSNPILDENPKISVIIPCFNLGKYLFEALESILSQSAHNYEIIVVDDGSDNRFTKLYLDSLSQSNIKIIRQHNQGLGAARNRGIEQSRGEYICCLDADDQYCVDFLKKACHVLDENPQMGFVTTYFQEFDGRDDVIQYNKFTLKEFLVENKAMVSSMFRKAAWDKVGGYSETLKALQDWDFWISLLAAGYDYGLIPEVLFKYRVRSGSMYTTTSRPEIFWAIYLNIIKNHFDLYQKYWIEIFNKLVIDRMISIRQFIDLRKWNEQLEQSKNWHLQQIAQLKLVTDEQRDWIEKLEQAKAWQLQQFSQLQSLSDERKAWINELEQAKSWWIAKIKNLEDLNQDLENENKNLRNQVKALSQQNMKINIQLTEPIKKWWVRLRKVLTVKRFK